MSDDIPRRINKIEEDVSKVQAVVGEVNTEIAVVKMKIDGQDQHLCPCATRARQAWATKVRGRACRVERISGGGEQHRQV